MANISGKINLTKLKHVVSKSKQGNDIIIIPVKANHLFMSEKGNIFLDITLWENDKDKQEYGEFSIQQSWPKEAREEGRKQDPPIHQPYVGNADKIGVKTETDVTTVENYEVKDDLPF